MGGACVHASPGPGVRAVGEEKPTDSGNVGPAALKDAVEATRRLALATTMRNIAMAHISLGDLEKAQVILQQVAEIHLAELGRHVETAKTFYILADTLRSLGNYDESEQAYRQCIEIRKETLGPEHLETGIAMNELAELYLLNGSYEESTALSKEASLIMSKAAIAAEA
eukprot:tig00000361_g24385.t1